MTTLAHPPDHSQDESLTGQILKVFFLDHPLRRDFTPMLLLQARCFPGVKLHHRRGQIIGLSGPAGALADFLAGASSLAE